MAWGRAGLVVGGSNGKQCSSRSSTVHLYNTVTPVYGGGWRIVEDSVWLVMISG